MHSDSSRFHRRDLLRFAGGALIAAAASETQTQASSLPNVVIIFCDDLGYGDTHLYGSSIPTPNIDAMAVEGVHLDQFSSTSAFCSPSRAALLTGRYPARVGVADVLTPQSTTGLSTDETTIAEMLKPLGYRTSCVGKWHLGSLPAYLPTARGFDHYWGIPYSNDQLPSILLQNTSVIESPVDLTTITQRYTEQATNFIQQSKDGPFFLYLAHSFPHIPLAASHNFKGSTGMGLYADVVSEIDWSVGQVLKSLKDNQVDNNTLVIFTSDNGPWFLGSPGKLRGRKGWTYEGGFREPFIARFPGRINPASRVPPGIRPTTHPAAADHMPRLVHAFASTMDILPTIASLCGAPLPSHPMDGQNIWPLLTGDKADLPRDIFLYFDSVNIQCARLGQWKLHVSRYNDFAWSPDPVGGRVNLPLPKPELYNLELDPDESYNAADDNPSVVADIRARIIKLLPTFPSAVARAWNATMSLKSMGFDGSLPTQIP